MISKLNHLYQYNIFYKGFGYDHNLFRKVWTKLGWCFG